MSAGREDAGARGWGREMGDMPDAQRVLIVDDESVITDTLVAIFTQHGYDARGAYSAESALPIIDEWLPQLAVLDVVLPGMSGIDLALLLRVELPECKVILMSGQIATERLLQRAALSGESFYIHAKPVPPLDLIAAARSGGVSLGPGASVAQS